MPRISRLFERLRAEHRPALIAYITAVMTLEPGDLIATGTPPGVGPIEPGSKVRIEIAGIGVLENAVVAES